MMLRLVRYQDGDPEERAALIPAAIDFWNGDINYWDRNTKNGKMMDNPYAFYRGTDQIYWYDFGQDARLGRFGNEHTTTWLSGDYHAYNAGSFEDNPVVYGLNDFDESVVADYQLDLWRLAVSVVLIARSNNNLSKDDLSEVIDALSLKYVEQMRQFVQNKSAMMKPLTQDDTYGKLDDFLAIVEKKKTREKMLDKWAPIGEDGNRHFDLSLEKLGSATAQEKESIHEAMKAYWSTLEKPDFIDPTKVKILDIARRLLAGTGSLGTDRFYVLLQDEPGGKVRIIDVKQQFRPAGYDYMGARAQHAYDIHAEGNDAKAVAIATRTMSLTADPFAGWMDLKTGKNYSVKERSPWKDSYPALIEEATGKFKDLALDSKTRYTKLSEQWASVLALHHAHARWNEAEGLERNIVYLVGDQDKDFQEMVRTIAFEYADQVHRDWHSFKKGLGADVTTPTV